MSVFFSGFGYSAFPETYTYMSNFHSLTLKDVCDKDLIPALGDFRQRLGRNTVLTLTFSCTVQILCIGTDRSQQTVQTKIRLLLKKQSDQGLRCLPFHQHLLDALMQCYIKIFYFYDNYGNCLRCPKF